MSAGDPEIQITEPFQEFDGETYGKAHGFQEETGDFLRASSGNIRIVEGPAMVAAQLVRTLKTPIGDDPLRPEFGLDRQKMLGQSDAMTKQAIIDAIGPGADPRVSNLAFGDIDINYIDGTRDANITVSLELEDGTPLQFTAQFRALLGVTEE